MSKDNLYIIGFPRGMTTLIYHLTCFSLNSVKKDINTSSGEYLNYKRDMLPLSKEHGDYRYNNKKLNNKFWTSDLKKEQLSLLDNIHKSKQFMILKDVTFPHIVCEFVKENKAKALIIKKDIPLVAYSCAKLKWFYLNNILQDRMKLEKHKGLIHALTYMYNKYFEPLSKNPNVKMINAEDVVNNPNILWDALASLGYNPKRMKFGKEIKKRAEQVKDYKKTKLYKELREIYVQESKL